VRQVRQEAEAGHEGVEAGAVSAATLARAVFAFWTKTRKNYLSYWIFSLQWFTLSLCQY
jgi:hypothetical protein